MVNIHCRGAVHVAVSKSVGVYYQSHAIISKVVKRHALYEEVSTTKSKILIALLAVTMASIILFASGSTALHDQAMTQSAKSGNFALLSDPSHINGTVTDAVTTLPIKDANVTAGNVTDLTDDNGRYDLDAAPGNYTVSVKRLGYFNQSKNATVLANMTTTVDFALTPNPAEMGWIAGNVTNANTSVPIEGATVEVDGYSTQTNATGLYKIQVPAPENYSVTASKTGYTDKTVSNVSVKAGNTTTVNIALTPIPTPTTGTLEGNVTDSSTHMPIENAIITAGNESAETNSSGHYKLELAPGTYNVTASKSGYVNQTKTGIVITAGNTTFVNFTLTAVPQPSVGTLNGNVTDASTHMPIENAVIMAGNKSAETNSSGQYEMELAPGTYNITASKNGYMNQTKSGIVITAGNTTTQDFALMKVIVEINATVVIHPRALNLRSEGKWISVSIEFANGFNVKDINVSSIKLNNTVPVDMMAPMEFAGSTLVIKFDRQAVEAFILQELAKPSKFSMATLTITGKLKDGATFRGSDTIKTIFNMPAPKAKIAAK